MRVLVKTYPGTSWLAAPTGMASKRLAEATGGSSSTIHSFLGGMVENDRWSFSYTRDAQLPIEGSLLIVDEFSMVDNELAAALFAAIPDDTTVVIVGDADQLPSVGAGSVLADLIAAGVPTTQLRLIHRQDSSSPIPYIARHVIDGVAPVIPADGAARFIAAKSDEEPYEVYAVIRGMIAAGVKKEDVRVLSPTWRTSFGVDKLNAGLQKLWNPNGIARGGILGTRYESDDRNEVFEEYLCVGDAVLMMKNDHQRQIFNGDILTVVDCGMHGKTPWLDARTDRGNEIRFEGQKQIGQLRLAFATTVHRAQGSQFPHVIVALVETQRRMLQRRLLYTAISRAQKTLTIVGHRNAIDLAVADAGGVSTRETGLCELVRAVIPIEDTMLAAGA
jgi:exodeoxyribonuclease V alpha subunit